MKFFAILPAALIAAAPAVAGPYVNIEANSGFTGSDYSGTVIDNHIGYEGSNWYIQGGPSIVSPDGGESEVELSGKVGGSVPLSEKLGAYGELSFITGNDDNGYGTKVGVKYSF
jgi:hypothetical protein